MLFLDEMDDTFLSQLALLSTLYTSTLCWYYHGTIPRIAPPIQQKGQELSCHSSAIGKLFMCTNSLIATGAPVFVVNCLGLTTASTHVLSSH